MGSDVRNNCGKNEDSIGTILSEQTTHIYVDMFFYTQCLLEILSEKFMYVFFCLSWAWVISKKIHM